MNEPLAAIDPIVAPGAPPLGYRLVPPGTLVPIYSPGLPILLAVASSIGGERMMYLVVPILGALAVWLTYRLGCIVSGPRTGLVAAVLLSFSPVFLEQLFLPMADLPATTWLLAAMVLALSSIGGSAFLAGVAAAAAVVTRPNLLPLAIAVILFVAWKRANPARLLAFAAGLAPAGLAVALFNRALYGSALRSGYGSLDALFSIEWIATNLSRYPRWLIEVHSLVILLGVAAPLLEGRSRTRRCTRRRSRIEAADAPAARAHCVLVVLCYIACVPFDGWPYLRFWLPAIPVLFVLAATVMLTAINRLPVSYRTATVLLLTCLLSAWYVDKTQNLGVFLIQREEQRYPRIGDYLSRDLPKNAVILSGIQSGSLRLCGGEPDAALGSVRGPRSGSRRRRARTATAMRRSCSSRATKKCCFATGSVRRRCSAGLTGRHRTNISATSTRGYRVCGSRARMERREAEESDSGGLTRRQALGLGLWALGFGRLQDGRVSGSPGDLQTRRVQQKIENHTAMVSLSLHHQLRSVHQTPRNAGNGGGTRRCHQTVEEIASLL